MIVRPQVAIWLAIEHAIALVTGDPAAASN
jgi:hypothetical protein